MATFAYKARNQTGEEVSGTVVADTPAAAARVLDDRTLLPIEVREVRAAQSMFGGGAKRVSSSKVGVVYEQLADLLAAGVPVLRALQVLSQQAADATLAHVLREVHDSVSAGDSLADAMAKHPNAFNPLHVAMIRAGEKGGFLEEVLTRVSEFVARQDELRNKFVGSMVYPVILMSVGLIAIVFVMTFVVPRIRVLLEQQELPWPTVVVFTVSDTIRDQYIGLLLAIALIVIPIALFFRTQAGQALWAKLQLRAWGVGKIYTMVALCRFSRIFGTLLHNGIPILHALRIAKEATGNKILADAIEKAADAVRHGESLTKPLAKSGAFPPIMIDMIGVAEEGNTLDKVLIDFANTQEARTARQIDLFVRLLEPLMLLVMGAMLLFVAVALLLPILTMATSGMG